MSYKNGVSFVFRSMRTANYVAGKNFLATDASKNKDESSPSEIDKNALSLRRNLPEPLPVRLPFRAEPIDLNGRSAVDRIPKKPTVAVEGALDDCSQVSGVPDEHVIGRRARIYVPARAQTQSGNNNTRMWKIDLDNRERWENALMGWCSSGDPISNVSGNQDFASKEDAIRFCLRQGWEYEVEEQHLQTIKPKQYGSNYSWNKRTRVTTK